MDINKYVVLFFALFLFADIAFSAEKSCTSLSQAECFRNSLDRCILDRNNSGYFCRDRKPPCETNWRQVSKLGDSAEISKAKSTCESTKGCIFKEPTCVCPCDFKFPGEASCNCACGGGLPGQCVEKDKK